MRTLVAGAAIAVGVFAASSVGARELTIEDRVSAQKAIEQVYWNHRIWPRDNPSAKPPLSSVITAAAIREKVDDYVRASDALDALYGVSITASQLQAEMTRMAKETRDPSVLLELFAALGNDPFLIAECLARPALADRMMRNGYARDDRFHGELRRQAAAALAGATSADSIKLMGAQYAEVRWTLNADKDERNTPAKSEGAVALSEDEWNAKVRNLEALFASAQSSGGANAVDQSPGLPLGLISPLQESNTSFFATAVMESGSDHVKTATVYWPKQPFDAWWARQRGAFSNVWQVRASSYTLVLPHESGCVRDSWSPIPSAVPEARAFHTAVWTGVEMIVWGGGVGEYVPTGGRYNAATDTWTPTSLGADVPPGRLYHTAVWTGTEMIVWGGYSVASPVVDTYNSGGRYNPTTDTWARTRVDGTTPAPRYLHTAIWTGTEMIVWGGTNDASTLGTGGRYDPLTDTWRPVSAGANNPGPRRNHTAVWTGTEMIIWGWSSNAGKRYDPTTDSWRSMMSTGPGVPTARFNHTAVWTGVEMIVWGGFAGSIYSNTGGRYNPINDTWTPTMVDTRVTAAQGMTAVWAQNEMIVWGGPNETGARYSPLTDSWQLTSTGQGVPSARTDHTAVWTGSEMIVWGGRSPTTQIPSGTGGRYDPLTDRWTTTSVGAEIPTPRWNHTAVWTGHEMIVWGGSGDGPALNTGGRYVPATNAWSPTNMGANLPVGRSEHVAVWTGREMVVWGGAGGGFLNSTGRYDPVRDAWSAATSINAPGGRSGPTAVWTGTEMIVWGGLHETNSSATNTGGRYNPSSDRWTATPIGASGPRRRGAHSAVWTGAEMIVWGGAGDVYVNTGDRYDPETNTWRPTSTASGVPSARTDHSAIWTGHDMIVFGGAAFPASNDGARYDPAMDSWTSIASGAGAPSVRWMHTAVWTGNEMIVWGGWDGSNSLRTGGRYDLSTNAWSPTSTAGEAPLAHVYHSAVWTGRSMLVWGGTPAPTSSGSYCACPDGRLVYRDTDGDGFGDPAASRPSCDGSAPVGYVNDATDCDDHNAAVRPGATETCNGVDDDCDGTSDEGDGALCEDDNGCTDDSCVGAEGCVHAANANPCDDENACTSGDTCGGGTCHPGERTNCDDGNCCTLDSCEPATGCLHTANTVAPMFTHQPSLGVCPTLWPPNHQYADFTLADTAAAVTSSCGISSIQFASCASSQPENSYGTGDGNTTRDCVYEAGALHVRAERDGACSPIGRVYETTLVAIDVCGNATTSDPIDIGVYHDRGNSPPGGTIYSGGGNSHDMPNGMNGAYGLGCSSGSPCVNGTTQDHADADPEMEITQNAAVSVDDLILNKASGGGALLTWSDPTLLASVHVTKYHVWILDPDSLMWALLVQVDKHTTTYLDPTLIDGAGRNYKVTAVIK